MKRFARLSPAQSALLELGLLFLPSIPAYLWVWPNIGPADSKIFQIIAYVYFLVGAFIIGLRRWRPGALGFNQRGFWLSLGCGLTLLLARFLITRGVDFGLPAKPPPTLLSIIADIFFYFCMVGLVEELLFRGVMYRAFEDWLGSGWAIIGTAVGFIFWHIFGQGPLIGLSSFLVGLIFGLIRWRTGSITWLIILHALWDLETFYLSAITSNADIDINRVTLVSHPLIIVGTVLLILPPLYLWLLHPLATRSAARLAHHLPRQQA